MIVWSDQGIGSFCRLRSVARVRARDDSAGWWWLALLTTKDGQPPCMGVFKLCYRIHSRCVSLLISAHRRLVHDAASEVVGDDAKPVRGVL